MASELDLLLAQHLQEGDCVSSGGFTLDPQKALEKIAHFQLPYADAWVLKLAQAAVLSGSEFLNIQQTSSATRFSFVPSQDFIAEEFERDFCDPSVTLNPAAEALRNGLWSVGIGKHRPFSINFPRQTQSFLWNGRRLVPFQEDKTRPAVIVSISHRKLEEGPGLPLLRNLQAAKINSEILEVITKSLFTLPLEVSVDGRRIDGFQFCPGHGFSVRNHPLHLIPLQLPRQTPLRIPPGTRDNLRPADELAHRKLRKLSEAFDSAGPTRTAPSAVALVTAHAYYQGGRNGGWRTPDSRCALYWVKHGVVIQKEEFSVIKAASVSLALIVCADDIPTDLTGFGLQESPAERVGHALCRALTPKLLQTPFNLSLVDRRLHQKLLAGSVGVALGGLALNFVAPGSGILAFAGILGTIQLATGLSTVDYQLEKGLNSLQKNWSEAFPET